MPEIEAVNATVILSFFSFVGFTAAAVVLFFRKRSLDVDLSVYYPLLMSILLYGFIVVSNFLEHSGITDYMDPLEDIAEIVFTLVFLFFINNWRKYRSEARFRALFKQAPLPLAEVTRDGRIIEVNDTLNRHLQECHGVNVADIPDLKKWWGVAFPEPEYRKWVRESWDRSVALAYETGVTVHSEEREMICSDGTKRTLLVGVSVIEENLVISLVDITERIEAEKEKAKLKDQLIQSQKLEAIGTLAGGVAHDFNNMLGAIIGYSELAIEQVPVEHALHKNLSRILEAAQRSEKLAGQLLTFARKQKATPSLFDVNSAITSLLKMLRRLIGENIELVWLSCEDSSQVEMDPSHFDQILTNLCVNAKDAISDIGKIVIETHTLTLTEEEGFFLADREPGEYVLISVTDNGCGMDKETLAHIFEPFFTTKGLRQGTGLGLATVYGIVKQNNGNVKVYSEPGQGTTFNIYLPRRFVSNAQTTEEENAAVPLSKGETILMVEDDPIVLDMGGAILQQLGYQTLQAQTAAEAIRIAETKSKQIDLFVTDMVMPDMNGKELAQRLNELRPGIKYLFMSGYTADIIAQEDIQDNKVNFIKKPFKIRDFALKIRKVLDGD